MEILPFSIFVVLHVQLKILYEGNCFFIFYL